MAVIKGVNAFITVSEADTYFQDSLSHESWQSFSETQKGRAIVTAATNINFSLKDSCKLGTIDPGEIPESLSYANAELALAYLQDPTLVNEANTAQKAKTVKAGKVSVQFFSATAASSVVNASRFPTQVMRWLNESGCLSTSNFNTAGGFASGTDSESQFENTTYDRTKGFF